MQGNQPKAIIMDDMYGNMPVPGTVQWTGEDQFWIGIDPLMPTKLAVMQSEAKGKGKPVFGIPHMNRQRHAIAKGLCDICNKSLKTKTKVSMSFERPVIVEGIPMALVVEPLCCKECARVAVKYCPHLRNMIKEGRFIIRQVFQYKIVMQMLTKEAVKDITGIEVENVVGHFKMALIKNTERNLQWLEGTENGQ